MRYMLTAFSLLLSVFVPSAIACEGSCADTARLFFGVDPPNSPQKPLSGSTVVSFLPRTDTEFTAVHSYTPSASKLRESVRANERLNELFPAGKIASPPSNDTEMAELLRDAKTDYVIIIGHNDQGSFVFPNGSRNSLESMDGQCIEYKVRCIFLSCSAERYVQASSGSIEDISPHQAYLIAKNLEQRLSKADRTTLDREFVGSALQSIVSDVELSAKREIKVKEIGTQAGAGFVVIGGTIAGSTGNGDNKGSSGG